MATKKSQDDRGARSYSAGTSLFEEGQPGDRMYVIRSGRVRISKKVCDEEVTLEELGPGEFLGELALVNDQPRAVSAMVVEDASLIAIEAQQFEAMLKGNSDIALRMMKKLCQRLTQAHHRVATMTLRSNAARLLKQLRLEAERHGGGAQVPIPHDIAEVLALELGEIKRLLGQFVHDELITLDRNGRFQIVDPDAVNRYLRFLELEDRFGDSTSASRNGRR